MLKTQFKPRKALYDLQEWAAKAQRKPLLLRGARQVGKSSLVRMLGQNYAYFIELNMELFANQQLFEQELEVKQIFDLILVGENITQLEGRCLLFIDEIQESPAALKMLRYFYEELPELHVIAAGSLLEFVYGEVESMPVGRITFYQLYPLSFEDFLRWSEEAAALAMYQQSVPISKQYDDLFFRLYHTYATIGGMPEVVATYVENNRIASLQNIYESIWLAYAQDIPKYVESRAQRKVTRYVMETAHLMRDRIKLAGFGNSEYKAKEVKEALVLIGLAGLLKTIYPTTSLSIPILPDIKRRPRLQFLDTGIVNYLLKTQVELAQQKDLSSFQRGYVIQHILTQELIAIDNYRSNNLPTFWVREDASANAEVDLLFQLGTLVLPIEIKSGALGRLRSLHAFMDRCSHPYAIRCLRNTFSVERHTTPAGTPYLLMNLPYFLIGKIEAYATYLTTQFSLD